MSDKNQEMAAIPQPGVSQANCTAGARGSRQLTVCVSVTSQPPHAEHSSAHISVGGEQRSAPAPGLSEPQLKAPCSTDCSRSPAGFSFTHVIQLSLQDRQGDKLMSWRGCTPSSPQTGAVICWSCASKVSSWLQDH